MLINQRRILHFILRGRKISEYPISEYPNKTKPPSCGQWFVEKTNYEKTSF